MIFLGTTPARASICVLADLDSSARARDDMKASGVALARAGPRRQVQVCQAMS